MVPEQEWPILLGPYPDKETCEAEWRFLERRGFGDTAGCSIYALPLPDHAKQLYPPDVP